jgi:acetone carboxylase gamma subunit
MRIHYYLEINEDKKIQCMKCSHVICRAKENYKLHVPRAVLGPKEIQKMPGLRPTNKNWYHYEYYCPGCYTMLDVELWEKPEMPPLWDIQIKI